MKGKLTLIVTVIALAVGTVAAYAWAGRSAHSSTQTIYACATNDGKLRVVAVEGDCKTGETPLSWNTIGPAGPTGPAGPQGPAGPSTPDPDTVTATVTAHGQKTGDFSQAPIEVTALSHEIVSPRDPASGLPTGQRQHKPLVLTMPWGKTTPLFIDALVNNENLTTMLVTLLQADEPVATIKLTNANVGQYDQHGPNVTFAFTYQKIEWTWLDDNITTSDDWQTPS